MNEPQTKTHADFVLPPNVITKIDVSHLVSELERIDDELTTASVRAQAGVNVQVTPTLSEQLNGFLVQNQITLATGPQRSELIKQLRLLKDSAPVIHMTFAVEADRESLQLLAQWLRTSVHPQAIIAVGLQPALIAGVYLRTPNHVKDLSLRSMLDGGHDLIVGDLEALRGVS